MVMGGLEARTEVAHPSENRVRDEFLESGSRTQNLFHRLA